MMKKRTIVRFSALTCAALALALLLSALVFAHTPAHAQVAKVYSANYTQAIMKTYHITVHTTNNSDSGICGNNWAVDSFDRTFTIASNTNTIQESFTHAKFVTVAGYSPNSCTATVGAGIHGTFEGEETVIVTGGVFNPKAACSTATPCNSTTAFVTLFYGPTATWTSPSFEFNYATHENGHWQNASADEGGNLHNITGLSDHDHDE